MRQAIRTWRSHHLAAMTTALIAVSLVQCATARQTPPQAEPPADLAAWEQAVDGAIENKGVARVERLGPRWMLTVHCNGRHSTYLDESALDLENYVDEFVRARYTYVERVTDVQCVRAPCPPATERLVALERLTRLPVTADEATGHEEACGSSAQPEPKDG